MDARLCKHTFSPLLTFLNKDVCMDVAGIGCAQMSSPVADMNCVLLGSLPL